MIQINKDNIHELDNLCCDAEAEELYVKDILDVLTLEQIYSTIQHILKKVARGGMCTFCFIDLWSVCSMYVNQKITDKDVNEILHSNGNNVTLSLKTLLEIIKTIKGFKKIKQNSVGYQSSVTLERIK